jgi:hypothetical protein
MCGALPLALPRCWATWANSCASRRRPAASPGCYWPLPRRRCRGLSCRRALNALAAAAAPWWMRTRLKSCPNRGSKYALVAPSSRCPVDDPIPFTTKVRCCASRCSVGIVAAIRSLTGSSPPAEHLIGRTVGLALALVVRSGDVQVLPRPCDGLALKVCRSPACVPGLLHEVGQLVCEKPLVPDARRTMVAPGWDVWRHASNTRLRQRALLLREHPPMMRPGWHDAVTMPSPTRGQLRE